MSEVVTIHDMLNKYYGQGANIGFNAVNKLDAPVLTSTTGVYNAVFGAEAFSQLNQESNVFGLLPKYPWQKSGFRVITADAGSTADGGVAENGTIPDSDKPTYQEITVTAKSVVHSFEVSAIHNELNNRGDDTTAGMAQMRAYYANLHAKRINEQLCVDGDTLANNNFESIDRVTASSAYATAVSWTAGDEDIYDIDRSTNSWADAVVSHNSGTDRVLTDDIIRTQISNQKKAGGRPNLMITGYDTVAKIQGLYENQVRYPGVLSNMNVKITVNGVNTNTGAAVGQQVATVYNIPLFEAQAVKQDTISRIYILDTTPQDETGLPRLGIAMLYPTLYAESGINAPNRDPFSINKLATKGMFFTAGELVCTFFAGQGSIRDLK